MAETYRQQRTRRVQPAAALGEMLELGAKHSFAQLTQRELAFGAKCKRFCDESRRFAAAGNVSDACRALATAAAVAQVASLSEQARLLCLAEVAPAEAYMERIYENWTAAGDLIDKSLGLDQELEERFGHKTKIAHRIHMLSVSAALLFQQRQAPAACTRISEILRYLAGEIEAPAAPGRWSQSALRELPTGLGDVLALQAVEVFYAALTGWRCDARKALVDALMSGLGGVAGSRDDPRRLDTPGGEAGYAAAGDYLELLRASTGGECEYLLRGMEIMERTRARSLVYSIALDSACLCFERGAARETAAALVQEIRRDARGLMFPLPLHAAGRLHGCGVDPVRPDEVSA